MIKKKLEEQMERLIDVMESTPTLSADYDRLLDKIDRLIGMTRWLDAPKCTCNIPVETSENANEVAEQEPFPTAEPIPFDMGDTGRATVVKTEEAPKEEKDTPLTKEAVRAILKEASEAGVLVQPIMSKYIAADKKCTFSNVKASDYAALVKELKDAQ